MKHIWIIGAGKFGMKALHTLGRKNPGAHITVIDKKINNDNPPTGFSYRMICDDGTAFLTEHLKTPDFPDMIIPAVPIHVVYEWITAGLQSDFLIKPLSVPDDLSDMLPNSVRGKDGGLFVSNAHFICPENCPEPEEICTCTGKSRPVNLYSMFETLCYQNFQSVVVRSHQLAQGIGGYSPKALFRAMETVSHSKGPILIGTACRCHGVVHAFEIVKR